MDFQHIPSKFSVAERNVLRGCTDELMFQSLPRNLSHPHESERVKFVCVLIVAAILMYGGLGCDN